MLEKESDSHVAMKETTAYLMTDMLKNAVANGTGGSANFRGMTIAGKTGTTNKNYDRYFVGYTPYYVAAVWTGYEQPEKISYSGNPAITMWKKVMQPIHENLPNKDFDLSSAGLTTVTVCADSGMKPTDACRADVRGSRTVSFLMPTGSAPTEECTMHKMVDYCTEGQCLATENCPEECVVQKAVLDYVREDYGVSVSDDPYLLVNMEKAIEIKEDGTGGCPAHANLPPAEENPVVDPENPETPPAVDPNAPLVTPDPGGEGHEGYGGGGTTTPNPPAVQEPDPPVAPTTPTEPDSTQDPAGDGNWFDSLWNNP